MNLPFFISKRLLIAKENNNRYTRPIIRIAILAIALSTSVIILATSIVDAFKFKIQEKIVGFGSHIQIKANSFNFSNQENPITLDAFFYPLDSIESKKDLMIQNIKNEWDEQNKEIRDIINTLIQIELLTRNNTEKEIDSLREVLKYNKEVEHSHISVIEDIAKSIKHIQVSANKTGIAKNKEETLGIVLKGVSTDFNWQFFKENLIDGNLFLLSKAETSNSILISENISKSLSLNVNDDLVIYFLDQKARKFKISGIYNTGLIDFDEVVVICDIKHVQKLNNWTRKEVGSYDITINDFNRIDKLTKWINSHIDYNLIAQSIKQRSSLFDWLNLQDMNSRIIIILMLIVGCINIITALVILVLERVKLIGLLKIIGMTSKDIYAVFLYQATYLVLQGVVIGNIVGLTIAFLQKQFNLIKLNPDTYYLDTVPIHFDFFTIAFLNFLIIIVCCLSLLLPSLIIAKIKPLKSIDFH